MLVRATLCSLPLTPSGIQPGGIIFPYMHNVYTDQLSAALRDTGVGCHICVEHDKDYITLALMSAW